MQFKKSVRKNCRTMWMAVGRFGWIDSRLPHIALEPGEPPFPYRVCCGGAFATLTDAKAYVRSVARDMGII